MEKNLLLLVHSPPKCLLQPYLGQAEVKSLEFNPSFPCGWQDPKPLSHHPLPPWYP